MKSSAEILRDEEEEKKAIRDYFNQKDHGYFVEVGANDPTDIGSQTWHLEQRGWEGLLIEPIPELAQKARQRRKNSTVFEFACVEGGGETELTLLIPIRDQILITGHASLQANMDEHNYTNFKRIHVRARSLTSLLEETNVTSIDLLSIDVEGAELGVLKGLDFGRFRPRLILMEDKHLYLTKHRLLRKNGYKLVRRLNRNCWYIPQEDPSPPESLLNRVRLMKRMYVGIWVKKIRYALRHRTWEPFRSL